MWNRNLELYTCTCHCCKECGVVILSYIHVHAIVVTPHSIQQWYVHVYSSRLRLHILYNNGMYMYIAQDNGSTFFTIIACTCIKLKITSPHSLQQWHVHVYSSRLRLHILYNNGMYMYIAQDYDSIFFTTMACTCI
jgi:lipoprotein signal peptidase